MSIKKLAHAATGKQKYLGWDITLLKDDKTLRISRGKVSKEFTGPSVTIEYARGESVHMAYKYIHEEEAKINVTLQKEFTLLSWLVICARDQGLMVEDKFQHIDKLALKKFLNGANGISKRLEIMMDSGPELEDATYDVLGYIRECMKISIEALLSAKGDEFLILLKAFNEGKYQIRREEETSS